MPPDNLNKKKRVLVHRQDTSAKTGGEILLLQPVFVHIPVIQLCLFVFQAYFTALDEHMTDEAGTHVQYIAFADHDIGILACLKGARAIFDSQDFSTVQGNCLQGLLP